MLPTTMTPLPVSHAHRRQGLRFALTQHGHFLASRSLVNGLCRLPLLSPVPLLPAVAMAAMSLLQRASVAAASLCGRRLGPRHAFGGFLTRGFPKTVAPVRHSGGHGKRLFIIKPSGFYDRRFLNLMRFYILLTGIPVAIGITLINVFIGEAELAEIPEGYIPEHWEYFKHPISRWIARTFFDSPEKNYEKTLAILQIEAEKADLRLKELEVRKLMRARGDGPWYQYPTIDKALIDHSPKAAPDN
uniref:NADH dehydrogenase [ubiquinone] 1 beta subcomplex subunit 5, mitochondrial n=2 Tax=Equus TaxID=9789 RepID=F7CB31_HORSE